MANYSNLRMNTDYKSKSLILDGISFNHVQYRDSGHANLLGRKTWDTTNASGTLTDENYAVNAVDIDWNGAQVGNNVTIKTTGELLSWIKNNPGPQGPQGLQGPQGAKGDPGTWNSSSKLGYQSIDLSGAVIPNGELADGSDKQFISGATMEDLLHYIGDLQHEIYVLSAAVISLANRNA